MTVQAKNRTPAALSAKRPQRQPVYTQTERRDRRRKRLTVTLDGDWSLTTEIAAICDPLAQRIATSPRPAGYWRSVDDLLDAVHQAVHAVVGLLAQADAERRTRHVGIDDRGRSIRALVDLTPRPKRPDITDDALIDGTWVSQLIVLAEPYSDDLSRLLGNARSTVVSDRLLPALREVDHVALALARRLDNDAAARAAKANAAAGPTDADRARAELQAMGVQL
jgi:hypothetical protein